MSNKEYDMNTPNLSSFGRVNSSSDSESQFEVVSAEVVREILDFLNLVLFDFCIKQYKD